MTGKRCLSIRLRENHPAQRMAVDSRNDTTVVKKERRHQSADIFYRIKMRQRPVTEIFLVTLYAA